MPPTGRKPPISVALNWGDFALQAFVQDRSRGPGPGRHKENQEGKGGRSSRASRSCPVSHPGAAPGHLDWVEPGDAARHPKTHRWPPRRSTMRPRMAAVPSRKPRPGPGYLIKKGESQPPASTPLRLPRRVSGQSEPPHKTSPLIAVVQQAQISGRARRAGQKAGRAPSAGARSEPGECCWARPSSFCPVYREYVL